MNINSFLNFLLYQLINLTSKFRNNFKDIKIREMLLLHQPDFFYTGLCSCHTLYLLLTVRFYLIKIRLALLSQADSYCLLFQDYYHLR